jgi:putative transposase
MLERSGWEGNRRLYATSSRQEFIRFLKKIVLETPPGLNLHIIVDNYSAHKHPAFDPG